MAAAWVLLCPTFFYESGTLPSCPKAVILKAFRHSAGALINSKKNSSLFRASHTISIQGHSTGNLEINQASALPIHPQILCPPRP